MLLAVVPLAGAAGEGTTLLRLDGVGPLRLGMTSTRATATGWIAEPGPGCELERPTPTAYRLTGPKAPAGLAGSAMVQAGRLSGLSFTRGVRTAVGVVVGRTRTTEMVRRYRAAGFGVRTQFDGAFGGTFVVVRRAGRQVLGGFAERGVVTLIGIPAVPVCE